jgi:subtilisin-like proprotein convertase family protein
VDIAGAVANTIGGDSAAASNVISGNAKDGVLISGTRNVVEGNFIGTDKTGALAVANKADGVAIGMGASTNTIGGALAGQRNIVSGNGGNGVLITDTGTMGNVLQGNYIGTDVTGTKARPNSGNGVVIASGAEKNLIGGTDPGELNVISGNLQDGVQITGDTTQDNVVSVNYIGVDATGSLALGGGANGIEIDGAPNNTIDPPPGPPRPIISGFPGDGILVKNVGAMPPIRGFYIGTDATGTTDFGNGENGVELQNCSGIVIGGAVPGQGNLISGNAGDGILISGDPDPAVGPPGNTVQGNFIGTDITGTVPLGNDGSGVEIDNSSANQIGGSSGPAAAGNVISGNGIYGVFIHGIGAGMNQVQGNAIGADASGGVNALGNVHDGVNIVDAPNNSIGGPNLGDGNVILGNAFDGIRIAGSIAVGNMIQGNSIGSDATNSIVKGNSVNGVEIAGASLNTVGGPNPGDGNFILGNGLDGVNINGGGAMGNIVQGNHIGINQTLANFLGNHLNGVDVHNGATGNTITGNFIAGNTFNGVLIFSATATGNMVQGNLIGTDDTGAFAIGNGTNGVAIGMGASANTIGGAGAGLGNVISANMGQGVLITGSGASSNVVQGNFIGTDATGTVARDANGNALGNALNGVLISGGAASNTIGGATAGAPAVLSPGAGSVAGQAVPNVGNLISGNTQNGVSLSDAGTTGNLVQGNFIGTDVTGLLALGNLRDGVLVAATSDNLIGGAASGTGNLISGNGANGVEIANPATRTNTFPAPNLPVDIPNGGQVTSSVTVANTDLVTAVTVEIDVQHVNVEDLSITLTAPDGTVVPLVAANVVPSNSANYTLTVFDDAAGIFIGNGTAPFTGSFRPVGHLSDLDYRVLNGTWTLTVSSNGAHPVTGQLLDWTLRTTTARGNQVEGNFIGTDATGSAALGNAADGVLVKDSLANTIGGIMPALANTIAFNGSAGVAVTGATSHGNSILGNALFANARLGIDLGADGVTANDAAGHAGPNGFQNFPVLTSAVTSATATTLQGTFSSTPKRMFRLEFFSNPLADSSGFGQGLALLGSMAVMTNAQGNANFAFMLPVMLPAGLFVAATATDPNNNTSEFSAAVMVDAALVAGALTPPAATEGKTFGPVVLFHFTDTDPTGVAANYTATITWGDGNTDTVTAAANAAGRIVASGNGFDVLGSHTYAEELTGQTFTVSVTDNKASATASNAAFNVADAPLTAGALTPPVATEGKAFGPVALFHFTDTDPFGVAGDYTATIAWDDGSTTPGVITGGNGSFTVLGSHTYADEGSFAVGVTIKDDAPGSAMATATSTLTVADRDVLAATGLRFRATARRQFTGFVATFTDTNLSNVAGDFTATIDWGDGTAPSRGTITLSGRTFRITGSNTFRRPGKYKVTVTIADQGGTAVTIVSRAQVLPRSRSTPRRKPKP